MCAALARPSLPILSVSALTAQIKGVLEGDFHDIWVEGELTGVKVHTSGHCYFSLKDANAQIACNLWRSQLARLRFKPQDGQKVLVKGSLSVYEPRGSYNLNVASMEPRGLGELQMAFEQLKARLQAEGLFEKGRKRALPFLVSKVGLVTSPTGAAVRDLLQVMYRRNPSLEVTLAPARVQGAGAAEEIAQAIERLNRQARVQVIIVGRGGGSYEDLFCFNEEVVARAIANSKIPTVSAVGHEVDVTISDYVADLRAPTPSAAAELVIRERTELLFQVDVLEQRLMRVMQRQLQALQGEVLGLTERLRDPRRKLEDQRRRLEGLRERLDNGVRRGLLQRRRNIASVQARLKLLSPQVMVQGCRREIASFDNRLQQAMQRQLQRKRSRFERVIASMDALSPLAVLGRGYAIAQRKADGRVIQQAAMVQVGEEIRVRVAEGSLDCRVIETTPAGS